MSMYVHHACAWFPWRLEEGSDPLELESQMIVNHQVSIGDCGSFGRGVMAPNQISRSSTLFCKMVFLTGPGSVGLEWLAYLSWDPLVSQHWNPSVYHRPWLLHWCWGANTGLCGCTASFLLSHRYSPSSTMWTFQSISRCLERIYLCVNERGVIHSAFQRKVPFPVYLVGVIVHKVRWQWQPTEPFQEMVRSAKKMFGAETTYNNHSTGKENMPFLLWVKSVFRERHIPKPTQKTLFIKRTK